jgi:type IV pilus assembly protein PilM
MRGRTRIGVDIGSTGVRAVELAMGGGMPKLVRAAQVPLPAEAVTDGEVKDADAVAEALRELWSKGRFGGKEAILGVGNQRVVVREVSLPWLPDKELRQSLAFQVQEFVPIPVEEAVLDYKVLEEFEREGRRMLRLLLVAAQKVMVAKIVEAAEAAKLRPTSLDLVPFAIVRSVGSIDGSGFEESDMGDEAVVDIGADVTSICVHAAGLPRFVRILPSGGGDVTETIARALGVSNEDAESLKVGNGVSHQDPARAEEARKLGHTRAAAFADEVRSSLDFYASQTPGAKIGRVLLSGGGSKQAGLTQLLDDRLSAEVHTGHPFHRVSPALKLDPEAMAETEPLLAVAVGLAIPGGR